MMNDFREIAVHLRRGPPSAVDLIVADVARSPSCASRASTSSA